MGTKRRKKTGGRKKGTPNKGTLLLSDLLDEESIHPIKGLKECLDELESIVAYGPDTKVNIVKAKASIYMDIMQYLFPKRKAIETKVTMDPESGPQVVQIQWADEGDINVYSGTENEAKDAASNSDQPK